MGEGEGKGKGESPGKWHTALTELIDHQFDSVHRSGQDGAENVRASWGDHVETKEGESRACVYAAAERQLEAIQLMRYARELGFKAVCKAAFAQGRQEEGLGHIRSQDALYLVLKKELKGMIGEQRQLESNVEATRSEAQALETKRKELEANVHALDERRDRLEKRKQVVQNNFTELRESVHARDRVRKGEILRLRQQLEDAQKQVAARTKVPNFSKQLAQDRQAHINEIDRRESAKLDRKQREHIRAIDAQARARKKDLDAAARVATKQVAERYSLSAENKKQAVERARCALAQALEQEERERKILDVRKRIALGAELLEKQRQREERKVAQEVAELVRARQTLQKLWQDHPVLLTMSPQVHAYEELLSKGEFKDNDSSSKVGHYRGFAMALQGFMENEVLPLVDLPNERLAKIFQQCSEQVQNIC